MWRDLGMTEQDWERMPPAVRSLLVSLKQQVRLLEIRCAAYEQELVMLRQQATRIEDLQAEIAELRERLGQTSRNSSRPPSSDPPHQKRRASGEPTDYLTAACRAAVAQSSPGSLLPDTS